MKFSKYQDTPQRAQSPSLFPVAFLSARISFSISSQLSFLLRTPQHRHELASPWLTGCVPLPGGGGPFKLSSTFALRQPHSSPGHDNHI